MKTSFQNYNQPQVTGEKLQTIILDPLLTAETDKLNPEFSTQPVSPPDPDEDEDEEFNSYDEGDEDFPPEEDMDYSDDIESDLDELDEFEK